MPSLCIGIRDVRAAADRIASHAQRTPVLTSAAVDDILGARVFFKCENFQKVGAFKFRGALNAVSLLSPEQLRRGVVTHSSGNHAAALALAARIAGTRAHIVMPSNAPEIKKSAVAGYGAEITFCRSSLEHREATVASILETRGCTLIHPYDHPSVIAGQGTAALELLAEIDDLEAVLAPVGGGGLLSGTAIAVTETRPQTRVIGAEPSAADDAWRSLAAGRILPSHDPKTVADGLLTSLGELTFPILQQRCEAIVTVSEDSIIRAMRLLWERMKIVIEPSAAVAVAALLDKRDRVRGQKIGVILSGGNVDLDRLPWQEGGR